MPPRDWQFRLEDMLQAIEEIMQFTRDVTCDLFCADIRTLKAVLYSLVVSGRPPGMFLQKYRLVIPKFRGEISAICAMS